MLIAVINGPFGVGKSSAASLLVERMPSMMLFDPEVIGSYLHRISGNVAMPEDYQDFPLWRHLVVDVGNRLCTDLKWDLILPMCFWRHDYFDEIVNGLSGGGNTVMGFRLTCSHATLRERILGRRDEDGGHEWCLQHMDIGLQSANDPRFGYEINTEDRSPAQVVDELISHLKLRI